jgi:hypothetical protein
MKVTFATSNVNIIRIKLNRNQSFWMFRVIGPFQKI